MPLDTCYIAYTPAILCLAAMAVCSLMQVLLLCRPALRTAHQTVILKQYLYVFGGELTSLNQAGLYLCLAVHPCMCISSAVLLANKTCHLHTQ